MIGYPCILGRSASKALQYSRKVKPLLSRESPAILFNIASLHFRYGFSAKEIFHYGLIYPTPSESVRRRFVSKRRITQIQNSLNPRPMEPLLEEKALFYRVCAQLALPVPELYALFFRDGPSWSTARVDMNSPAAWTDYFRREAPDTFIIKPSRGVYGRGIRLYTRTANEKFADADGNSVSANDITSHLYSNEDHRNFVIQQQMKPHPAIVELSGSSSLQTVRVITFVDDQANVKILRSIFKPIVGRNIIDNHTHGTTGNLTSEVSLETGRLGVAVCVSLERPGLQYLERHPETGVPFEGFPMPQWPQICEVAKAGAAAFLPIRAIGWDIGLTPNGPVIIEGNFWWDAPIAGGADVLLEELTGAAAVG
jgi:hypothetical protein